MSFDRESGLWKSNSFSQGKVQTDMFAEYLIKSAGERHSFVNPSDLLDSGCYPGPDLIPPIPAGTCVCGSPFISDAHPEGVAPLEPREVKVYTKLVSAWW